jgi:hypothetical protein
MIGLFDRIPYAIEQEDFRRNRELIRPNRELSYGISEGGGAIHRRPQRECSIEENFPDRTAIKFGWRKFRRDRNLDIACSPSQAGLPAQLRFASGRPSCGPSGRFGTSSHQSLRSGRCSGFKG